MYSVILVYGIQDEGEVLHTAGAEKVPSHWEYQMEL